MNSTERRFPEISDTVLAPTRTADFCTVQVYARKPFARKGGPAAHLLETPGPLRPRKHAQESTDVVVTLMSQERRGDP